MKKIHIIIAAITLIVLSCNKEEAPEPAQVQPTTTTPTGGSGTGSGGVYEYTFYIMTYNEGNYPYYTTTPLRDLDTLFNSIIINGVNIVDSLKPDNANLNIGGSAQNGEEMTLYSLRFDAPTDILANPFEITIDAKEGADVGGWSTADDIFMFIGQIPTGNIMNTTNFTSHCNGLNTYTVVAGSTSTRYKLVSPCQ
jgi:hypothetical protein